MTDELLKYYEKELAYIRSLGSEFAQENPKIADQLQLRDEGSADPHVERLIQSFAFLNARIRHKLDDDFPEMSQAVLQTLYPHYLSPIPSMCIAKLEAANRNIDAAYHVDSGTEMTLRAAEGETCRFRTCYPVTVWPFEVSEASAAEAPYIAPQVTRNAEAVVRIKLDCISDKVNFKQLSVGTVRFYLKAQTQHVYRLYELLMNDVEAIALAASPQDRNPLILENSSLKPVGFEADEGMLPYSHRSFVGYRLLTEFFCFPEKFLFFDLQFPDPSRLERFGTSVELYLYLTRFHEDLVPIVDRETFQLGCTPAVNLFRQTAEPIHMTHLVPDYRVQPDSRRPLAMEVFSIDRVRAVSQSSEEREFHPFFSIHHGDSARSPSTFWHATRRASVSSGSSNGRGTEVDLHVVDLHLDAAAQNKWTLMVETTCLNRNIPWELGQQGTRLDLRLEKGVAGIKASCATTPTRTFRPPLREGSFWCLVSHLSLNHLSLIDSHDGADALREILRVYDFVDSDATADLIEGIVSIGSRRVVGRVGSGLAGGFCRGVEIGVEFDTQEHYRGITPFLLASVLERFLGLYCSINSFTQLVARTTHNDKVLKKWPPRAGERVLL